jgi:hypothetical protein
VVILGDAFRGMIHPCKIYNILAIGSPFVYIGPTESHVAEIISALTDPQQAGTAQHGQVDVLVRGIYDQAERFRLSRGRVARFANTVEATLPQLIDQFERTCRDNIYLAQTPVGDPAAESPAKVCATNQQ